MPVSGDKPAIESAASVAEVTQPSEDAAIGRSAIRKASLRLLPVIAVGYGLASIDRLNISFAELRMNADLHFSATIYGLGAGLFFIGYAFCEVPSNLLMLRYGARRWLARIMLTWGLLAAAMMFVRTPFEFYSVRFLLGMAEAGFFPGVIYYLTLWFPARNRARAVSGFYVSLPLSATVMGSLAGWLLGLDGRLGLTGWQWLFLVEGLPAAAFSLVIWFTLPDSPAKAAWLTDAERTWLQRQLEADSGRAHLGHSAGVLRALFEPKVWVIGMFFFCALTCSYAYQLSAPAIYQEATGWSVGRIGAWIAGLGIAGALAMFLNGAHSDRTGERRMHIVIPCLIMGAGYLVAGAAHQPMLQVVSLGVTFVAYNSMLGPSLAVPTQFLAGRAAAAGIAAMNTITMFSGFVGPVWMNRVKDVTGHYQPGVLGLVVPSIAAAAIMVALTRSLARNPVVAPAAPSLAEESA